LTNTKLMLPLHNSVSNSGISRGAWKASKGYKRTSSLIERQIYELSLLLIYITKGRPFANATNPSTFFIRRPQAPTIQHIFQTINIILPTTWSTQSQIKHFSLCPKNRNIYWPWSAATALEASSRHLCFSTELKDARFGYVRTTLHSPFTATYNQIWWKTESDCSFT
jgi:hypothetical protein